MLIPGVLCGQSLFGKDTFEGVVVGGLGSEELLAEVFRKERPTRTSGLNTCRKPHLKTVKTCDTYHQSKT